jgi:hypothetical protein
LPYFAIKGIAQSLPDVPSVPPHPEEVSFPKRYFVVLQERAKLAYINVFDG